jgi:hypothetical protein
MTPEEEGVNRVFARADQGDSGQDECIKYRWPACACEQDSASRCPELTAEDQQLRAGDRHLDQGRHNPHGHKDPADNQRHTDHGEPQRRSALGRSVEYGETLAAMQRQTNGNREPHHQEPGARPLGAMCRTWPSHDPNVGRMSCRYIHQRGNARIPPLSEIEAPQQL